MYIFKCNKCVKLEAFEPLDTNKVSAIAAGKGRRFRTIATRPRVVILAKPHYG